MAKHRIYLRLMEKEHTESTPQVQIARVRTTIERLNPIEWEELSIHPRGGVTAIFYLPKTPDYDRIVDLIDREGWMSVI